MSGLRCTFPGCVNGGTERVALVLYADEPNAPAPMHQVVKLPAELRCKNHQPKMAENFLTDERWNKMRAHFVETAKRVTGEFRLPERPLTSVVYYKEEEELGRIEVFAVREKDAKLEEVGKIKVVSG